MFEIIIVLRNKLWKNLHIQYTNKLPHVVLNLDLNASHQRKMQLLTI
jgi:hypothetical protein